MSSSVADGGGRSIACAGHVWPHRFFRAMHIARIDAARGGVDPPPFPNVIRTTVVVDWLRTAAPAKETPAEFTPRQKLPLRSARAGSPANYPSKPLLGCNAYDRKFDRVASVWRCTSTWGWRAPCRRYCGTHALASTYPRRLGVGGLTGVCWALALLRVDTTEQNNP